MASFGALEPSEGFGPAGDPADDYAAGDPSDAEGLLGLCRAPGGAGERKRPSPSESGAGAGPLDLDTEEGLDAAGLESRELLELMAKRRAPLGGAAPAREPAPDDLALQDREARRALSTLAVSARDLLGQVQGARDLVHLQAGNAAKLRLGGLPHGFPGASAGGAEAELAHLRACFGVLRERLAAAGQALDAAVARAQSFERDLTLTRRAYEAVAVARVPSGAI